LIVTREGRREDGSRVPQILTEDGWRDLPAGSAPGPDEGFQIPSSAMREAGSRTATINSLTAMLGTGMVGGVVFAMILSLLNVI
jgi:hypothetical protein